MATGSSSATVSVTVQRQTTPPPTIVLHLRLPEPPQPTDAPQREPLSVTWDSGVVNNEGMGKRKSKKCCIFHKQRPFDESDSESDDDDEGGWELDEHGVPRWVPNPEKHGHDDQADGCEGCCGHDD
jgi:protein phosphatase 1 regulatory subunit 11